MDEIVLKCNKNTVYVLNSNYCYGELHMINLFGSPAGRALSSTGVNATTKKTTTSHGFTTTAHKSVHSNTIHSEGTISHPFLSRYDLTSKLPNSSSNNNISHNSSSNYNSRCSNLILSGGCTNFCKSKKLQMATPFKSSVIAKKAKFWKFLEDDKCKTNSIEDLRLTNKDEIEDRTKNVLQKYYAKTSTELYREAAQLLGLSCTYNDNCRCIDCQGRYFDFDDSDSFSECSYLDDVSTLCTAQENVSAAHAMHNMRPTTDDEDEEDHSSQRLERISEQAINHQLCSESLSDISLDDSEYDKNSNKTTHSELPAIKMNIDNFSHVQRHPFACNIQ